RARVEGRIRERNEAHHAADGATIGCTDAEQPVRAAVGRAARLHLFRAACAGIGAEELVTLRGAELVLRDAGEAVRAGLPPEERALTGVAAREHAGHAAVRGSAVADVVVALASKALRIALPAHPIFALAAIRRAACRRCAAVDAIVPE